MRDCAGETRGSGRTKPYRGIRRVEGCPSVLRKSKVLIFIEEKGFVRDGKACGERYVSILCPGKDSVFFRPPIFLLELHSPSRSKDTSSVSLTLDTFTPESRALWVLSPSGTLGVQAPLRGRLAKCDALRLFLAALRPAPPTAHRPRVRPRAASPVRRPHPVPTTDHEPLLTVRYFIARAASPVRRRPRPAPTTARRTARSPARRFADSSSPRVPL